MNKTLAQVGNEELARIAYSSACRILDPLNNLPERKRKAASKARKINRRK